MVQRSLVNWTSSGGPTSLLCHTRWVVFDTDAYHLVSVPPANNISMQSLVLAGIEGAENISDDIVVHGLGTETHNKPLRQTIERLQECANTWSHFERREMFVQHRQAAVYGHFAFGKRPEAYKR